MSTTTRVGLLIAELRDALGADAVTVDLAARERASVDGAAMSPVLKAMLPLGLADLVAYPADAEQIAFTVAAAVRHHVAVTPRGRGTGNYGQAAPLSAGLVLDTSRARAVIEVGDGYVEAEAGATLLALEQAALRTGQQLLIFPSTVHSTVGGFVSGGSGGTGSIRNGLVHHGRYVLALDVVHGHPDAALHRVEGPDAQPYVHNYGTAGIVARVRLGLEPAQDWHSFYASFPDFVGPVDVLDDFATLEPTPRLVSADPARLADALPDDPAVPSGRASLRAILDPASLERATSLVEAAGGRVEAVRTGPMAAMKVSMSSYNHPIEWLQRAYPDTWVHLEVSGRALVDRTDDVLDVFDDGLLHLEAQRDRPIGMLVGAYRSKEDLYAAFERLAAIDVGYHNCHQWYVDHEPGRTAALAATTDPHGLLNPGKLVATAAALTGSQL